MRIGFPPELGYGKPWRETQLAFHAPPVVDWRALAVCMVSEMQGRDDVREKITSSLVYPSQALSGCRPTLLVLGPISSLQRACIRLL